MSADFKQVAFENMVRCSPPAAIMAGGVTWLAPKVANYFEVSWLAFGATDPLVGGVVGGVATAVTWIAMGVINHLCSVKNTPTPTPLPDINNNEAVVYIPLNIVLSIGFSMAATALGYPVSMPLACILACSNFATSVLCSNISLNA